MFNFAGEFSTQYIIYCYVVGSHWKCLGVRFLMSASTKRFYRDVRKKSIQKKEMIIVL